MQTYRGLKGNLSDAVKLQRQTYPRRHAGACGCNCRPAFFGLSEHPARQSFGGNARRSGQAGEVATPPRIARRQVGRSDRLAGTVMIEENQPSALLL